MTDAGPVDALAALQRSHERLESAVGDLTPDEVEQPAYPSEWTIAQTVSHLGSGAQIFTLMFRATVEGTEPPDFEAFKAVWAVWDAKAPYDQVVDGVAADAEMLSQVGALTPDQARDFRVSLFNGEQDLQGFLRTRLGEHAVHTWDVVVPSDPDAGLEADAAELILANLPWLAERAGKPLPVPLHLVVATTDPELTFRLDVDEDGPRITAVDAAPEPAENTFRLPAEAFVRLVYGRLDSEHTPAYEPDGVDLDTLRRVFPGF